MPLAARALADQADHARDTGRSDARVIAELDRLCASFPEIVFNSWAPPAAAQRTRSALTAWYEAEVQRSRRSRGSGDQWLTVVSATAAARLPWLEAYACWRAAEALLSGPRDRRDAGVQVLRRGHALAEQLQAATLRRQLEALSGSARVSLSRPESASRRGERAARTDRPGAGNPRAPGPRTDLREIARTLVISEKTVSSHVSNLLRKTGTTGRVQLSRLASRVAQHHPDAAS